jgi:RNA 3'-terminal phosphate cyclase (ATP)
MITSSMIEIDGSLLEGGGQMLRVSTAMACILQRSTRIFGIRANRRPKGGLGAQHAAGLRLASKISGMAFHGAELGSSTVEILPTDVTSATIREINEDCGTAGAISLMIQVSYLVASYSTRSEASPMSISLRGGTNVLASPPMDHLIHVLQPILTHMGLAIDLRIIKRGYYPVGGGLVEMMVHRLDKPMTAISLIDQGHLLEIRGVICALNCNTDVLRSIKRDMEKYIKRLFAPMLPNISDLIGEIVIEEGSPHPLHTHHRGNKGDKRQKKMNTTVSIQLYASASTGAILSANALYDDADINIDSLVDDFYELFRSGAAIDEHTADQLLLPMALAHGMSQMLVAPPSRLSSLHLDSVIHILKEYLGPDVCSIEAQSNGCRLITVHGIGCRPS